MLSFAHNLVMNGYLPGFIGNTDSAKNYNFDRQVSHYVQATADTNGFGAVYGATEPKVEGVPESWEPYTPSALNPEDISLWVCGTTTFDALTVDNGVYIDFTIANSGCANCCVASFILHKSGVACTNDNIFKVVELATKNATDGSAALNYNANFNATIGGQTVNVQMERLQTGDVLSQAKAALKEGKKCLICMVPSSTNASTHFVLADGYDDMKTEMVDWFLASDPSDGVQRILRQAINARSGHSVTTDTFTYRIIY